MNFNSNHWSRDGHTRKIPSRTITMPSVLSFFCLRGAAQFTSYVQVHKNYNRVTDSIAIANSRPVRLPLWFSIDCWSESRDLCFWFCCCFAVFAFAESLRYIQNPSSSNETMHAKSEQAALMAHLLFCDVRRCGGDRRAAVRHGKPGNHDGII